MITRRRFAVIAAASTLAPALFGRAASAQSWPTRFVRFIVPFPAGVAPDVGCRMLTARLSEIWGQQAVVENKPGAGGNIGTETVERSAPDVHRVDGRLHARREFVSLQVDRLRSGRRLPARDTAELPAMRHDRTERLAGADGGGLHQLRQSQSRQDQLCFGRSRNVTASLRRVIQTNDRRRDDACALSHRCPARTRCRTRGRHVCRSPVRPTARRPRARGLAGFDVAPWWGLFLPAKTAPEVVARLHSDTIAILAEPAIRKRMQDLGSIPVGSTPDELARYLQAEMAKWRPVIRDANIRLDG